AAQPKFASQPYSAFNVGNEGVALPLCLSSLSDDLDSLAFIDLTALSRQVSGIPMVNGFRARPLSDSMRGLLPKAGPPPPRLCTLLGSRKIAACSPNLISN